MNAVLGMADLLWDSTLTMEQRRYLSIMRSNGVALLDLINDILDLAKVESGGISLEKVDFDIRELVDRVADTMGVRAHEKHIDLPPSRAGVPENLVGDPLRLRQVMINLLGNAVKFTDTVKWCLRSKWKSLSRTTLPDCGFRLPIRDRNRA